MTDWTAEWCPSNLKERCIPHCLSGGCFKCGASFSVFSRTSMKSLKNLFLLFFGWKVIQSEHSLAFEKLKSIFETMQFFFSCLMSFTNWPRFWEFFQARNISILWLTRKCIILTFFSLQPLLHSNAMLYGIQNLALHCNLLSFQHSCWFQLHFGIRKFARSAYDLQKCISYFLYYSYLLEQ